MWETFCEKGGYTPGSTDIAMENGPGLKMYLLLKMENFHPAMLVYWREFPT